MEAILKDIAAQIYNNILKDVKTYGKNILYTSLDDLTSYLITSFDIFNKIGTKASNALEVAKRLINPLLVTVDKPPEYLEKLLNQLLQLNKPASLKFSRDYEHFYFKLTDPLFEKLKSPELTDTQFMEITNTIADVSKKLVEFDNRGQSIGATEVKIKKDTQLKELYENAIEFTNKRLHSETNLQAEAKQDLINFVNEQEAKIPDMLFAEAYATYKNFLMKYKNTDVKSKQDVDKIKADINKNLNDNVISIIKNNNVKILQNFHEGKSVEKIIKDIASSISKNEYDILKKNLDQIESTYKATETVAVDKLYNTIKDFSNQKEQQRKDILELLRNNNPGIKLFDTVLTLKDITKENLKIALLGSKNPKAISEIATQIDTAIDTIEKGKTVVKEKEVKVPTSSGFVFNTKLTEPISQSNIFLNKSFLPSSSISSFSAEPKLDAIHTKQMNTELVNEKPLLRTTLGSSLLNR